MIKIFHSNLTKIAIPIFFLLILSTTLVGKDKVPILPGAYQTDKYFNLLRGKSVGIVANQTSMINSVHLVDSLKRAGFNIQCVFAPEHGFRGKKGAGEDVSNSVDSVTGIRVISIYGKHFKPAAEDLRGIDLMIFDIQDVGVRFYTYISTLQYVMESCAEQGISLIVLDRPNPNGFYIDGPILQKKYASFVGMQTIPVVYGMTIGEYALMLNGEKWLKEGNKCKLTVIPVRNYHHAMKYQLPVAPSPNLPDMDAIYLYPSICFFEGTAVSLGRGTAKPFRLIGYPGDKAGTTSFTPVSIPGVAENPPFRDTLCNGIDLTGEGKKISMEPGLKLKWLLLAYESYPQKDNFFTSYFEKLAGTDQLRKQIIEKKSEQEIRKSWRQGIEKFREIRKKYLLYGEK